MNYITGTNLIIIAILFIIGCLIASFLLVNFVKIIFAYMTNNIHQNYIKNSHLKSKYTIKGSFLRVFIILLIVIIFLLYPLLSDLSYESRMFPTVALVISLPFVTICLWLVDYKFRKYLINDRAINILIILEIILTIAILLLVIFIGPWFTIWIWII